MPTPNDTMWHIEPHTLAKHEILRRYLDAWFPILTTRNTRVVYIDGFCGPGRYVDGERGSPLIALDAAINHSRNLSGKKLTFLFIDERIDRIQHLQTELKKVTIPNSYTVAPRHGEFAVELQNILDDLDARHATLAPTFAFIDPFGFKVLPFRLVERLLST